MDDAENPDYAAGDASGNPPPAPVLTSDDEAVLGESEAHPTEEEIKETKELIRGTRTIEWLQFSVTALVAVVGIVAICIYYGQLCEMEKATRASETAANAAKTAVDNSVQQFRMDERAWLELESFQNEPVEMTDALKRVYPGLRAFAQGVTIRNYGRSVARNISVRLNMTNADESFGKNSKKLRITEEALRLSKNTATNKSDWVYIYKAPVATSLAPGSSMNATMPLIGIPHHTEGGKDVFPYNVGRIDYTDAFGVNHWKTFCFRITETDRSYCETGNDEDSNSEPSSKPN